MNYTRYKPPSIFKNAEPLQISCLKSISKNLDRVVLCGSQPVDIVLQKCVHVLQCFYSSKLLEMTSEAGLLEDSYLEFLINKYLTKIDFKYLSSCSSDALIQRFAEVGYVFQNVSTGHYRFADDECQPKREFVNKIVRHLPNVTTLNLDGHCNNKTLRIISDNCPKLEELYTGHCCISSRGLLSLCRKKDSVFKAKCNNLRILSLPGIREDNAIMFLLKHIPTLERLDYKNLPKLLCDSFQEILNSRHIREFNLTKLTFSMADFDDISIKNVHSIPSMCPRLKTLYVHIVTETHVEALCRFVGIENLTICSDHTYPSYQRDTMNYNHLFKTIGSGLKQLRLLSGAFSVSVLIRCCTNLESLDLYRPIFQSMTDDQNTSVMNKLVDLHLHNFTHSDDVWWQSVSKIFESCQNLKRLYLTNYDFSKSATLLTFLKKSCTNVLSLDQCDDVPMDLLEDIIRSTPSLQTLCILRCGFDKKSIKILGEISKSIVNFVDICVYNGY